MSNVKLHSGSKERALIKDESKNIFSKPKNVDKFILNNNYTKNTNSNLNNSNSQVNTHSINLNSYKQNQSTSHLQRTKTHSIDLNPNTNTYTKNYQDTMRKNTNLNTKEIPRNISSGLIENKEKLSKLEIKRINLSPTLKQYINSKQSKLENTEDLINENEKMLKEKIHNYFQTVRKNDGGSVNTLIKIRSVLVNWLKDSEQDNLEYSKFMTEKKIKYLLNNKDKLEGKIKNLEQEIDTLTVRKTELEKSIGDVYISYDNEELEEEINRFANCNEIKTGKSSKMLSQYEEMIKVQPLLKEYLILKENAHLKIKEKIETEKICKSSNQTLASLTNYYKNLRKKINELNIK